MRDNSFPVKPTAVGDIVRVIHWKARLTDRFRDTEAPEYLHGARGYVVALHKKRCRRDAPQPTADLAHCGINVYLMYILLTRALARLPRRPLRSVQR